MYKHILIATDLSKGSEVATQKALKLQKLCDAKLSVVHVVEPIPSYGYPGISALESPYIDNAKTRLAEIGKQLKLDESQCHVLLGPTKVEILKLAEELSCDLIIVGSHGHHGLSRLLGSTANAVLHGATCDVLSAYSHDE